MCIVVWPLMTLPPSVHSPPSLSLISALVLPWTTVRLPLSVIQITKKNKYIHEAHCMHHYMHTVIHTYKWSNDRSIRIKLNTAEFERYSRAESSTVTLLMADISRKTIMDKTTHNSQRYVSRGSQIALCPFVWRLSLVEKLISASHDGMILLISSHRYKNRDLISVLLNWLLVLNVDLISDWSYYQLESFPSNRFWPISIFGHVIH